MNRNGRNEDMDRNSTAAAGKNCNCMTKSRYKMVMFDMDGTLVDSYQLHAKCFQRFLKRYGVILDTDETAKLMGNTIKVILSNTLPEELHNAALQGLSNFYLTEVEDLIDEMKVIDGSLQILARIREKGLLVTLLTNSKKELVERIADKKGFNKLFDMIEAADSDSLDKESRCKKIIKAYDIKPEDVLYVGDSSHDVLLARHVGMTGCLIKNDISWLHNENFIVANVTPDMVIDDISMVLKLI